MLWFGLVLFLPRLRKKRGVYTVVMMLAIGGMGIGLAACIPEETETPSGPTAPPSTPTNTHTPAPTEVTVDTPSPSTTPDPRLDSETGLFLPVEDARITILEGGISECDPVERVEGAVPSLDINPPGSSASTPVFAPAQAEVMIVDEVPTDGAPADPDDPWPNNQGLGNFVALRVQTGNLTSSAQANLTDNLNNYREPGFVYVGYAHLSQISVTPGTSVGAGSVIGMTGVTGLEDQSDSNRHLDISAFYVPDMQYSGIDPIPQQVGLDGLEPSKHFQNFNGIFGIERFQAEAVNPKWLWPDICRNGVCDR